MLCADEKEDIFLTEQPIKWLLPPGLSTTGEPPEAAPRPKRSTSNSDPSVKFKRQPSSRRLAQVHLRCQPIVSHLLPLFSCFLFLAFPFKFRCSLL